MLAADPDQKLIASDDDFSPPANQATTPGPIGDSKLSWNDAQVYALCEFIFSTLELSGGSEDNPRLWEDVAGNSELWGSHPVSAQELQDVYTQVTLCDNCSRSVAVKFWAPCTFLHRSL